MGCLTCKRCMVAIVIVLILIVIISLIHSLRPSDECYAKAAVAADAGTCSEIGRDILKRKGSAVDAAIATLLCLSLFNAHSIGIGGGGVFTIYNASTGKVETIDAREVAPMSASENMFGNNPQKSKPGLFIAVPGELRGYELAHKRHGRLQWKELFMPSIKLAREGFKLGRALAKAIYWNKDVIMNDTTLCEVFCDSNNNLLKENDSIRFPQLALTYEKIAEEGPNAFYDGSLTQDIVDAIQAAGGIVTREDLKGFKPVLNEYAFNFTVGNYIYHAPDAPFGGPILALILNILKGCNISSSSVSTTENKILTYHRMIETFRFASAHKSGLGDPRYKNITSFVQEITSDSYADHIRSKINDETTETSKSPYYPDNTASDDYGTTHLSIIAEDGSAVAVTSSINEHFGSNVMSRSTGIIFNDQMQDFDNTRFRNSKNNFIEPGKKPRSSMCPTIILDKHSKKVRMVVGASGGPNITSSTAQVILNHLFFDYDLQKAVNEPRVHSQLQPSKTFVEENIDESITDGLKLKNHIIIQALSLGKVQAIVQQGDKICAESDHRKGGYPAGY